MFDMSWGEVLVIGAVALIVIGPKDLPKALRTLGNMTSQVKKMASEFQSQFNEAMREAELDDIKKEVSGLNEQVSAFNPLGTIHDELKGAIESTPAVNAAAAAADAPAAEPAATAAAAPLPGEPAFDLALPAPPALSGPLPEPADATAAAGPVPAESPKA
jgi:sec-independent protein translocase protein TatB